MINNISNNINVIPARLSDGAMFYEARFSKEAIAASINKEKPTYLEHINWYGDNYKRGFFTIIYKQKPIGYIRIDKENKISISIISKCTRHGIGTIALHQIVSKFNNLTAEVFKNNTASIKMFQKFPEIKLKILE